MKKVFLVLGAVIISAIILPSCNQSSSEVTIGNQVWMAENLNVDKFRNGDAIPEVKTREEWWDVWQKEQPAWCYYDNDSANGAKYGRLYNWYAVNDSRGLAPKGWHVPSDAEWSQLSAELGHNASKMKSIAEWIAPNAASNSSGFSGLPGGSRSSGLDNAFSSIGSTGSWWSSLEYGAGAWYRTLESNVCIPPCDYVNRYNGNAGNGFSVRCLRD